jgi:stage II sporulation protein M
MDRSPVALRFLPAIYRDQIYLYWLRITAIAFVALIVGSYIVGRLVPDLATDVYGWMTEMVKNAEIQNDDGSFSALTIFLHNFLAMMYTVLYGLIPFLYLPALLLGVNALGLGFVGAYCVNGGMSIFVYLTGILPHGIFELSAVVLALSAGFYLCARVTHRIRSKEKGVIRNAFALCAQLLFLHVGPLLLIAAFIEAHVTPAILRALMK